MLKNPPLRKTPNSLRQCVLMRGPHRCRKHSSGSSRNWIQLEANDCNKVKNVSGLVAFDSIMGGGVVGQALNEGAAGVAGRGPRQPVRPCTECEAFASGARCVANHRSQLKPFTVVARAADPIGGSGFHDRAFRAGDVHEGLLSHVPQNVLGVKVMAA